MWEAGQRKEGNELKIRAETDLENLLRSGVQSNPAHQEALRARLFRRPKPLSLDDLDQVIGGAARGHLGEAWETGAGSATLLPFPDD